MTDEQLSVLENKIGYQFKDKNLFKKALTHKTYAYEASTPIEYNERLEFLGDSILDFTVAEQLYKTNKYFSEGELTRRKAQLVNNSFLAKKAKELNLGKHVLFGKGEKKLNGEQNPTNLANTLEALIGAIYLDSNLESVQKFILNHIFKDQIKF